MSEKIFYITTIAQVVGLLAYFFLTGCSPKPFQISNQHTVTEIKIEPYRGPKVVYHPERFV